MATSKTNTGKPQRDSKRLEVETPANVAHPEKLAELATEGALAVVTLQNYAGCAETLGAAELLAAMRQAGNEIVAGDTSRLERVLAHQFLTLDTVFNNLAQRSGRQDNFKGIEVLMRLALKAQAQARATAETLALMKNPMPYIKQANIANGPQQVNNAQATHAEKIQTQPNELLEHQHGNTLDFGATAAPGRADSAMAAVGKQHRPKNRRR
ncbi:MAG: hypothetical protein KUL80_08955 [Comamonas sp.]|nr:hypothetical protein [Comamonas sp.]